LSLVPCEGFALNGASLSDNRNNHKIEPFEVVHITKFKSKGSKWSEENDGNSFESGTSGNTIKCLYHGKLGHISKV
jgi:hypothetical protein